MKRITILVAALTLLATGAAFAGAKAPADCTCQASQTQGQALTEFDLLR